MDASIDEPKFNPEDEPVTPAAPDKPPTPNVPRQDATENAPGVMDTLTRYGTDALTGVARGAENAVKGARETVRSVGAPLAEAIGFKDQADLMRQPLEYGTEAPQTLAGGLTAGLTEAALSWVTGGAVLKGAGLAVKGTTMAGAAAQTAAGSFITSDPNHERLSNMLAQYPVIGPVFDLLAQKPDDNAVVAKAKSVFEEAGLAALGQGAFNAIHVLALKFKGAPEAKVLEAEKLVVGQGRGNKDLTLDQSLPSNVLTSKTQVAEYKQVKMSDLAVREADHMNTAGRNPIEPDKVKAFQGRIAKNDIQQMPPVDVTTDPLTGELRLLDGRHRVAAAQAEGFETITAKVLRDKNAKELVADMQGGAPVTLKAPTGEPLVTLSDRQATQFRNLQDKLVIKNAIKPVEAPAQGATESAAKEGVPLRSKFNDSPNAVLQGLADLGNLTKKQLGSKVVTEESTRATAAMMGLKPAELVANLKAANASLEDIDAIALGARAHLQQQGAELFGLAKKALMGDPAAREAHSAMFVNLANIQAEFAQLTTKLGRGLHSYSYKQGPFDSAAALAALKDPKNAERMERLIEATGGDADKMAHLITMQNLSWGQKVVGAHNEYWVGLGLLSRLGTQIVNLGSTAVNVMMQPAAMIVGGVEQGLSGHGFESVKMGMGIYAGMRTAFFDSAHMAWQAMKTEKTILSATTSTEESTKFISSLAFNMNPDHFHAKLIDYFGEATRASFRGLTGGDEFFKQLSYRAYVSSQAAIEAAGLVKAGKLGRSDVAAHVAQALQQSIDDQGRGIIPEALKFAEKGAFTNDIKVPTHFGYPSIGELSARVSSSHPIVRGVILPFVKTPTNVTRTTFEYTPLIGQLRKEFYTDVAEGGIKQAMAIGKLTIGAGMYIGAAHLALEGRITGAPPAKGVAVPPGWKPYSVKFTGMGENGGDLYLSYQRLQPFGDVLGLTADFAKSTGMLDDDTRDGLAHSMSLAMGKFLDASVGEKYNMLTNGAVSASAAFGKSLISKSYFRNMTEFFSTFSGYNNENAVLRWFQNYSASHVPGVLSQFNSDDTVREVRSTLDAIMARIPGLSQDLPANRDYFGHVNDTKVGYPWSIVQPLAMSETKGDGVYLELQRLSASRADAKFNPPEHTYSIGGKMQDLKTIRNKNGETAYDQLQEVLQEVKPPGSRLNFHDRLEEIMRGDQYKRGVESDVLDGAPNMPGQRLALIKIEETKYRQAALDEVKNRFASELGIKSVLSDKINTLVGKKKIRAGIYDKLIEMGK